MPIQAFVDDSGGKGHSANFVLAGLISHAESWAAFSDEWRAALSKEPQVKIFKMKDAAGLTGQFHRDRLSVRQRDEKLRALARIINAHVKIFTYSAINIDAHGKFYGKPGRPQSDPYFWPFQNVLLAVCHTLWDAGWRERFEIIYDENFIFGPRAKDWYPVIRQLMQIEYPDQSSILPVEPMFKTDDEFLPIQAADLFAWCTRKAIDAGGDIEFEWLLDEMKDVQATEYSQYYDDNRLASIAAMTEARIRSNSINDAASDMIRKRLKPKR